MQPLEAGEPRTIGAYRLLGRLGAGGMGRVYLGRSVGGRTVAVKVVHPHFALDEQFRARFRREVEAARQVGAQWTAPVLDADPDAAVPWVATGYVAGPPLSQAVTTHGPLPEYAVRTLGAGLGEALAAVHAEGLIHRDVKPSNVLLALDGPRLIDFGIARATGATVSLTSTGVSVGSPGYMAPEQIRGLDISGAADVFSLGAVLAYAATGSAPFPGDSSAVLLYKVVHEEPELGDLEGEMREVVAGCLAKDPAGRPRPAELARRLAPGGAAAMVASGWLPNPLVREVSRAAVALLDLEPQDDPEPSGPARSRDASLYPVAGVFGPPLMAPPRPAVPPSAGGVEGPGRPGGPGDAVGTGGPGSPGDQGGSGGVPGPRTLDPRFSLTLNTGPRPGARRGRRVSCTVALAVAGALAAVTVGSGVLSGLLPDSGDGKENGPAAAPSGPSRSGEPSPGASALRTGALPKAFTGTWKGPVTERSGAPHGVLTTVFTPGRKGADVARMKVSLTVLGTTVTCHSIGELASATDRVVKIRERPDPGRPSSAGLCTGDAADLTFTLTPEDTLAYQSYEEGAGTPRGTLTRSGD
ncbi:serine/threonine-protein kinase [Streptomyces fulvorobeus]|uniref:Serine/threonine protein kinase n=1 Tax=Streptomyces fulvorobeus TaxID=284028 RepID=A0A7J0C8B3_9ACTN|nr:serine/threonine-protein kinase [Streptomyces fulvorobeus]NYE42317.1 serine/threonine protein kinase [Streptomyces fulvorobeus]GFM98709.1 serine/threonine protein kinase [Streptomyces fulvorobeus]